MAASRDPRPRIGVLAALLALVLVLAVTVLFGPAASAPAAADTDPLLARAARLADTSVAALTRRLHEDPTLQVDAAGRLRYVDPGTSSRPVVVPQRAVVDSSARAATPTRTEETFTLHSNPGARATLLLDFDGQRVADTAWNLTDLLTSARQPAWDPAGDGPAFNVDELAMIREVWAWVAEDYAPFDIDVTTEDTGEAALHRDGRGDDRYGIRLLVSPATGAQSLLCGGCGGISYVDVFDLLDPAYRLAWIFPQALGDVAKNVADAASHEAGHTLGLSHDGSSLRTYENGHGAWAPLMGSPYDKPVTQFSDGAYAGATNQEDDVAILTAALGLRTDEAPSEVATNGAAPVVGADGVDGLITSSADRDVYALGSCTGTVSVQADTAGSGANLDIGLSLLDADGRVLATADPVVAKRSYARATGLDASLRHDVGSSTALYVRVDGVGHGTASSGYTDYGSLGRYRIGYRGRCDSDPGPATTPDSRVASSVVLTGPRRAAPRSRPRLGIQVWRAIAPAAQGDDPVADAIGRIGLGSVQITVTRTGVGRRVAARELDGGVTSYRLPRMPRRGVVRVRVDFAGDETTDASSVVRRIRVAPAS